ncbi:hypothetical protein TNCV_3524411 [Trichonephila clavipes]|uniref:Uncharacterized protein n=1 Tax=Trichonephila clavipes TaxID=2585209 RepID=A0A8X6S8F6_TRICX|nr:hypothetical protein TNCV_3524411 [Trichonephila clavipes]
MFVGCLPENSFSRLQLQGYENAEEPLSVYIVVSLMLTVLCRCRCFMETLADLSGGSTTCLELIPKPGEHFQATCNHRATSA